MEGKDGPPSVLRLRGPSALLPRLAAFSDLSAGTEFVSYKDPQWRFLLGGEEITGFSILSEDEMDTGRQSFDGCVLKVDLRNNSIGFGMVLVRPNKRGMGLAKALIRKAMRTNDDGPDEKRYVLAVCSSLGQPLYRNLGFKIAGMVTLLTCTVCELLQMSCESLGGARISVFDGKDCTKDDITTLAILDERATGIKRRDRIELLLRGYAEGSRAAVAFASKDNFVSTAVARQDCIGGPLSVGPVIGREDCCIPLLQALAEMHFGFGENERSDANNITIMLMVSDHPHLVEFLEANGMKTAWASPAMSSDGRPVYENGDGSYLAMMHPTLG